MPGQNRSYLERLVQLDSENMRLAALLVLLGCQGSVRRTGPERVYSGHAKAIDISAVSWFKRAVDNSYEGLSSHDAGLASQSSRQVRLRAQNRGRLRNQLANPALTVGILLRQEP